MTLVEEEKGKGKPYRSWATGHRYRYEWTMKIADWWYWQHKENWPKKPIKEK